MASNIPDWAVRAPMVVMDERKLSYFAKAAAIRAGVRGSAGALMGVRGLGATDVGSSFAFEPEVIEGEIWNAPRAGADAGNTQLPGSLQTVGAFSEKLSNTVRRLTGQVPRIDDVTGPQPGHVHPWWHWALFGVGALGVGAVVWRWAK